MSPSAEAAWTERARAGLDSLEAPLRRLTLHRRIAVFITVVVVAVVLAFAYLGSQAVSQSTAATLQERQATTLVMTRHLDDFVGDAQTSLSVVATELVDSRGELDRDHADEVLARAMQHVHLYFSDLVLLNSEGQLLAVAPSGASLEFSPEARAALQDALQTTQKAVSNRLRLPGGEYGVLFVSPVLSTGRVVGLLAGTMPMPHPSLTSITGSLHLGNTGHMEVIDASGNLLAFEGLDEQDQTEHPDFYLPLLASGSTAVGRAYSAADANWHIMAFAPLSNAPWGVGVGQTEAETFAPTVELRDRTLAAAATALAVTLAFAWVGTQSVVKPIRALTQAGEHMATGDLSQPIGLAEPDEVGRLARVLETMRQRLRESLQHTAELNRRLEHRVQERTQALETSNRHLHALMQVATAANAATDHEAVMRTALRELVDTLQVRGGWVSMYDDDKSELRLVTAYGVPKAVRAFESTVVSSDAPCMQALASSESVCVAWHQCPLASPPDESIARGECWITPIRMDQHPLGVLCLLSQHAQKLDDEAKELLEGVAQQLGMVFLKARLADDRARFEAARRMEILRAELLASVSHELRTPLGFIKGYTTTLLRDDVRWDADHQQEFLHIIDEETDHLTELVDSVLDVARAQAGRMRLNVQPVDAAQVVRRSLERISGPLSSREVRMDLEPAATVDADSSRLEQVLLNLLMNATKYSAPDSPIDINVSKSGADVRIAVLDRGVGITSADAQRIFEPFYRVQNQASANVAGAGLGLAVCRAIVEAHGGRIWAEPRERGGTGVYVALPAGGSSEVGKDAHESNTHPRG